ncbi:TonB-dependent receptor [Zhongshania sp.]|uniref:TonB-dependent receptor n=1 Tax=Zhongshania sp. TaxID=1971902 RepID=UPI0035633285
MKLNLHAKYQQSHLTCLFITVLSVLPSADVIAKERKLTLEEIIVTAQKRDQSLQDVPVAVTALTRDAMDVNAVSSVVDLSGLAPNLTVRPAVGGTNLPAFNMRGITSYGVVAGSDKQISIYLDGVYIGSPRGSMFTLPDIQQLEVLRGPQGTLFGRNATGGAVSVSTRNPNGEWGFRQKVSTGNRNLLATETSLDFPAMGPISLYLTYAQEKKDGDIDNKGAGIVWDRSAYGGGKQTSPETLGAIDNENFFLAARFEPTESFSLTYKYDYSTDHGTPRGNAMVTDVYTGSFAPADALIVDTVVSENADKLGEGQTRPDAVDNTWTVARDQSVRGHSLNAVWDIDDNLVLKNTFGYREVAILATADITATSGWKTGLLSSLLFGVPPGTPFCFVCSQANGEGNHWSNEIQLIYSTEIATLTTGALYYESEDESGSPRNSANVFIFATFPDYTVPAGNQAVSFNEAESYAVYSQSEFHLSDNLDFTAGARYTVDAKSGSFVSGNADDLTTESFSYDDQNISYLLGLHYQINDDIMVYAKYSTAFVSGGSVGSFAFDAEQATSWEAGSKADFLDGRLRSNIAVYHVRYEKLQTSQGGANVPGAEKFAVLIVEGGDLESQGLEFELTALPAEGLTISAALGYQDNKFTRVTDLVAQTVQASGPNEFPNSDYLQTLSPEWNGNLSTIYETNPVFGDAYMSFGLTGIWRTKVRLEANPGRAHATPFGVAEFTPETWIVNARIALKEINLGNEFNGEVAVWARNLTDDDNIDFITNFGAFGAGTFVEERSYGIDLIVKY